MDSTQNSQYIHPRYLIDPKDTHDNVEKNAQTCENEMTMMESPFGTVIPSLSSHFYVFCSKSNESNEIWIGWKWNPVNLGADILRFFLSFF